VNTRIPIPTDNIYKFYALFGLTLLIFSIGSVFYITSSNNKLVFETVIELDTLNQSKELSPLQETKVQILERKLEITKSDTDFRTYGVGGLAGIAVLLIWYGFHQWHTVIQPMQDEITKLSILKLKKELRNLNLPNR